MNWKHVNLQRIMAVFFLLLISLPSISMLVQTHREPQRLNEKRRLAPFPPISWHPDDIRAFPRGFEDYLNDHFRFRATLIHWRSRIMVQLLKKSSNPKVLLGEQGWLFYKGAGMQDDFLGADPFSPADLDAVRRLFEARRDWLARRNCAYLLVVPPNKQSVYPQYIPPRYRKFQGRSRLDQLAEHMQRYSDLAFLDLRSTLRANRMHHDLYRRTDTHWNPMGAFRAYQRIVSKIRQRWPLEIPPPRTLAQYQITTHSMHGGDLADLLGLKREMADILYYLTPKAPLCAVKKPLAGYLGLDWRPFADPFAMQCRRNGVSMVMLRDSFGSGLIPYLAEHFSRSVYVWVVNPSGERFARVIEAEQPQLVIEEIVERSLPHIRTSRGYHPPEEF